MKKILLLLFFIATNMETIQLNAYCFYNYSKDKTITIYTYPSKKKSQKSAFYYKKAQHELKPGGSKRCRNWKTIDKKDRKKTWYWVAYEGGQKFIRIKPLSKKLGEGYFPIGGAVYYSGWYKDEFSISYDGKEWEYWKSPWKHKEQPWKTYKH